MHRKIQNVPSGIALNKTNGAGRNLWEVDDIMVRFIQTIFTNSLLLPDI